MWMLAVFLLCGAVSGELVRYDNHKVFRVVPTTPQQLQALMDLRMDLDGLSFWSEPRGLNIAVDVMVSPHKLAHFHKMVAASGMNSTVYIDNVQTLMDNERPKIAPKAYGWTDYYRLADIYAWIDQQVASNPGVASTFTIGSSYEGRDIRGLKISYKSGNPAVIIESGAHAREWVGVSTATWIANELLQSQDPAVRNIAENFDWYIVPVLNTDGYEYTFTNDRMWRKTRSVNSGTSCRGADPNRNFDFYWMSAGASNSPCDLTFAGRSAFSEVESKAMADFATQIKPLVYLCFHSYSQLLMIPYGVSSVQADNYNELMTIGEKAIDALYQVHSTRYDVGPIWSIIYPASGSSSDWMKGVLGTRFTYTWELRDTGFYGFMLPANQIIPTAEETFASVLSIALDVQAATA